jgi:hypothetical protein
MIVFFFLGEKKRRKKSIGSRSGHAIVGLGWCSAQQPINSRKENG